MSYMPRGKTCPVMTLDVFDFDDNDVDMADPFSVLETAETEGERNFIISSCAWASVPDGADIKQAANYYMNALRSICLALNTFDEFIEEFPMHKDKHPWHAAKAAFFHACEQNEAHWESVTKEEGLH